MPAVAARLGELMALLPSVAEIEELLPVSDDEVLLKIGFHGKGRWSGVPVDQPMGCLVRVRNGKIDRWRPFLDYDAARRAAGLAA